MPVRSLCACPWWGKVGERIATVNSWAGEPLAQGLGALVGIYVVYRLGLRAYFKQKQAEYSRERYLEGGIEQVTASIAYALAVHRRNWSLFYRYLKLYRDSPVPVDFSRFKDEFEELDQSQMQVVAVHRIQNLVNDPILWEAYQRVLAFVTIKNDFIKGEFIYILECAADSDAEVEVNKEGVIREGEAAATRMSEESHNFYVLLSRLLDLSALIE